MEARRQASMNLSIDVNTRVKRQLYSKQEEGN
jgi:hypothetical protein